jgi:hypothetical protein
MPAANFDRLRRLYTEGSRAALTELSGAHPSEDFYAYALYSDDGAMTVVPAANSEQSLQRVTARYVEDGFSIAKVGLHHLRYCPDEWAYSGSRWEVWQEASEFHDQVMDAYRNRDAFVEFKHGLFQMMIDCLRDLDHEGLFGDGPDRKGVTLMIWVTDSGVAHEWWVRSVEQLNPKPVFMRFSAGLRST